MNDTVRKAERFVCQARRNAPDLSPSSLGMRSFERFPSFSGACRHSGQQEPDWARVLLIVRSKDTGPGNVVYSGKNKLFFSPLFLCPPRFHERMTRWGGGQIRREGRKRRRKIPASTLLLFGLKQDPSWLSMKFHVQPEAVFSCCLKRVF